MPNRRKCSHYQYAVTYSQLDRARDLRDEPIAPIEFRFTWGRYNSPEHRGRPVHLCSEHDVEPSSLPIPQESLLVRATAFAQRVQRVHGRVA